MLNKDDINKRLGQNIRAYRIRNGWTQEELADKVGYSSKNRKQTISCIELGKMELPISRVLAFAKVFNITPEELLHNVYDDITPVDIYGMQATAETNPVIVELLDDILELNEAKLNAVKACLKAIK